MELDSSNGIKFSRHIIVVLDVPCFFRNVNHAMDFATKLHKSLFKQRCTVLKMSGDELLETTLIDRDVYTGNRNYRIVLSSK